MDAAAGTLGPMIRSPKPFELAEVIATVKVLFAPQQTHPLLDGPSHQLRSWVSGQSIWINTFDFSSWWTKAIIGC